MNTFCVGDPVDVISGAQFDVALDFRIVWPFAFEWRRYYDTRRVTERLALGWGHTHSYDHRLRYDINGLIYVDPSGDVYAFDPASDQNVCFAASGMLRRSGADTYRVKVKGQPECEFVFRDPEQPAQLRRVFRGRAFHELRYDSEGRWSEVQYRQEPAIRVESETGGRLVAMVWRRANNGRDRVLWEAQYDSDGNLVLVRDPYQNTQLFSYDAAHRMIRRTDRRGFGFEASYDATGRCIRSAAEDGVQEVKLRYQPEARVSVVTRADGGAWQYFYGDEGVSQIVDPYGGVTRRSYDKGRLALETGPEGEVLQQADADEPGLLKQPFTPPVGMCLPFGDPWFQPVRDVYQAADALDWEGHGARRCRNAIRFPRKGEAALLDLPAEVIKNLRFAQNAAEAEQRRPDVPVAGTAIPPKKPMGVPDRPGVLRYDSFGELVSHTLPGGETARWQYDPNGNVIRYVDYAGSEWRYEYASWNLRVKETDPLGNAISYQFNLVEKPTKVVDAGGTTTEQVFDFKDRLTERRRHRQLRDQFGYDLSNGVKSLATEARKVRVVQKLGPQRRPVEIAVEGQPVRKCTYDDRGRLAGVEAKDAETLKFAYATLGNWTADLRKGRGVEHAYTAAALAKTVLFGKFSTTYERDSKSKTTTIVDPLGGRHAMEHPALGIFLRRQANGVEELSQYDWHGQCLAKVRFRRRSREQAWSRVYRYSAAGALLSAVDSARGAASYQYDAAHRLVAAVEFDGKQDAFSYDAAGNLLSAPGLAGTSYSENRLLAANGKQLEYNARQNVVGVSGGGVERRYEYDAEDRLTSCREGPSETKFRYDALGRRIAKETAPGVTEFIWDGERLAAEISPGGAMRVYVHLDARALTPFAFIDYASVDADPASGQRRYVFSNQVGCPVQVQDEMGQELWSARIDAYGRAAVAETSQIEFNLRWPGHYFDGETGLHYNRHRYYSPEFGRYLQVDPRDLEGGINVYAYPARPLDQVDVDGLAPCPKKPMVTPDEDDTGFQQARQEADDLAEAMRAALQDEIAARRANGQNAQDLENTTLAAMVVQEDGEWKVIVSGNRSDARLPASVNDAIGDRDYVGYGDTRPPNVLAGRDDHGDWVYPTQRPDGTQQPTSHTDAEQRGLRANDCNPNTSGVAYVAPTRPCCPGCYSAITTPSNDGGWGGNNDNISDRGLGNH